VNPPKLFPHVLANLKKLKKEGVIMDVSDVLNSKAVKAFVKGSFVVIGLFAVLYCGAAGLLLLRFGHKLGDKFFCVFIFVLAIPLIAFVIFLIFFCSLKSYCKKLHEGTLDEIKNKIEECLTTENDIRNVLKKDRVALQERLDDCGMTIIFTKPKPNNYFCGGTGI